jgi:hypothetical protein
MLPEDKFLFALEEKSKSSSKVAIENIFSQLPKENLGNTEISSLILREFSSCFPIIFQQETFGYLNRDVVLFYLSQDIGTLKVQVESATKIISKDFPFSILVNSKYFIPLTEVISIGGSVLFDAQLPVMQKDYFKNLKYIGNVTSNLAQFPNVQEIKGSLFILDQFDFCFPSLRSVGRKIYVSDKRRTEIENYFVRNDLDDLVKKITTWEGH